MQPAKEPAGQATGYTESEAQHSRNGRPAAYQQLTNGRPATDQQLTNGRPATDQCTVMEIATNHQLITW